MNELRVLADHVDALGDITCPLCGETDFDVLGFVFSHDTWCEVRRACVGTAANSNADVASALRARAAAEEAKQ